MTDEQINAAINAAIGNSKGCPRCDSDECAYNSLPNYCGCLNAMHEAEDKLSGMQYMLYATILDAVEGSLFGIRATARQRAEAFLRTLGKWEPVVKECFTTDLLRDATKMVGEVQP